MLTAILAVTLVVNDIETASDAYQRHLSYQVVDRGELEPELAEAWGAPLAARSPYAILQPKSGAQTYLRLIERPPTEGYRVMLSHGWNSNEILVEDPVALTAQFRRDEARFESRRDRHAGDWTGRRTQLLHPDSTGGRNVYQNVRPKFR